MSHATDPGAVMASILAIKAQDPDHIFTWADLGHGDLQAKIGQTVTNMQGGTNVVPPLPPQPPY